ncbi:MAG: alpha/beta fold hydrolase [Bacillota bacterium]
MTKKTVTLNNHETYYYLETNKDKPQTILLVHGNMSSGVHYQPLIERIKDYHVLAPDLRGFGDSTYLNPIASLEDFADDLHAFLDAVDVDKVVFVGWSTGGGIGLKFAAKYPERISQLVLLESASYRGYPIYEKDDTMQPKLDQLYQSKDAMAQDPVQVAPAQNAMENNNKDFMKAVWEAAIYNVKIPEDEDLYLEESLKQRNLIDVDWALMTFNMSHTSNGVSDGDGSIDDVTCNVLSIYGKKDLVILQYMFDETVKALHHVQTKILENGSHSPITDDPDYIHKLLIDFIA